MIQPLIRAINFFLGFFEALPIAIKNLIFLVLILFVVAVIFHFVHASR